MNKFIIAAAFAGVAVLARYADAAEKTAKPTVCLKYAIAVAKGADDAVGICYDGVGEGKKTKPTLYYRFEEVSIVDGGTGRIKVLVGWR